jgi:hypothetical protein
MRSSDDDVCVGFAIWSCIGGSTMMTRRLERWRTWSDSDASVSSAVGWQRFDERGVGESSIYTPIDFNQPGDI